MDLFHKRTKLLNDLPLHCSVRWLSGGKVLERFADCFDAITAFLIKKVYDYPELEALFDAWTAFVAKIGVYSWDIESGTFRYFKHLKDLSGHQTIS